MHLSVVVLVALVACKKETAEPGGCYREQDNFCVEFSPLGAAAGKRLCAGQTWVPGESPCRTEGRLGSCGKPTSSPIYYSGPPNNYSVEGAKIACEHGGGIWIRASN